MYDQGFYDTIRAGIISSAEALVPVLYDIIQPMSVLDVGCGEGWWAQTFKSRYDCEVVGVDGAYVLDLPRRAPDVPFIAHDLIEPFYVLDLPTRPRFDLVVCLEVAEHLPPHRAVSFIEDIVRAAPVIAFSAAIPGQGGTGHLNEQWPDYWAGIFATFGYAVTGNLRFRIWNDDRIENWYRQNLLIAADPDFPWIDPLADLFSGEPVHRLVHPVLYDARRKR